jgi:hypothetical protein
LSKFQHAHRGFGLSSMLFVGVAHDPRP